MTWILRERERETWYKMQSDDYNHMICLERLRVAVCDILEGSLSRKSRGCLKFWRRSWLRRSSTELTTLRKSVKMFWEDIRAECMTTTLNGTGTRTWGATLTSTRIWLMYSMKKYLQKGSFQMIDPGKRSLVSVSSELLRIKRDGAAAATKENDRSKTLYFFFCQLLELRSAIDLS